MQIGDASGEAIPSYAFSFTNLARSLYAMFPTGTSQIVTERGIRATLPSRLDARAVSYDTNPKSI
jgi:hypothetical protein